MRPFEAEMNAVDRFLYHAHQKFFIRWKFPVVLCTWLLYAVAFILLAPVLGVSDNYLVILPVLVTALGFGFRGGLVAGIIALPSNLGLFALRGLMDQAPASLTMAELSGIFLGSVLGYLSDYWDRLEKEYSRRRNLETELRKALTEKEVLLQEVHHRVKNNLATIKSLVQLQLGRSPDPSIQEASHALTRRIIAISLVHEQLYHSSNLGDIDTTAYLESLCRNIADTRPAGSLDLCTCFEGAGPNLDLEDTVSLGLMANEIISNSLKHAVPPLTGCLQIRVSFTRKGPVWELEIDDNGQGMPEKIPNPGMGLLIIRTLASSMEAELVEPGCGQNQWSIRAGR